MKKYNISYRFMREVYSQMIEADSLPMALSKFQKDYEGQFHEITEVELLDKVNTGTQRRYHGI